MPIFPSGKRRVMEAQQTPDEGQRGLNVGEDAAAAFRAQPQQEDVVDEGGQMSEVQTNNKEQGQQPYNAQQMQQQMQGAQDPQQAQEQQAAQAQDADDELKNQIFRTLEELGVPPRQLKENAEKILEVTHDLDTGMVRGFYLIPTYTQGHEVNESHAKKLAAQIGQRFNLSQKLKAGGMNYRVDFQSNVAQHQMGHGTSFDQLGGKQQGGFGQQKAAEVAPSMQEMMKVSKDCLFNALKKQG